MSAEQFINGQPDVTVPGLVRMDSETKAYSLLEDPGNVIDCGQELAGLASSGDTLYVLCWGNSGDHVYSWDSTNYFQVIDSQAFGIGLGTLNVDTLGNPYGIYNRESGATITYYLVYYDASNGYQSDSLFLFTNLTESMLMPLYFRIADSSCEFNL